MVLNTEWAQVEVIDLINDGSGLAFGIIGGRSTGVVVKTILPGGVADRDGRLQSGDHILQIGEVNLRGLGSEQVASVLRQCGVHVRMVVARPVEPTSSDYQSLRSSHAPIVPTKLLGDPNELDRHLIENGYTETLTTSPSNPYTTPYIFTGQHSDLQLHPISGLVDVVRDPLPIGAVPIIPPPPIGPTVKLLPLDMALRAPSLPETETFTVELHRDDLGLGITVAGYVCEREEISGIFVKSISEGRAAALSKRIEINDRIVEVDSKSVLGFTNHQAVEMLRHTGPTVMITFERYLRGPKYEQLQQAIKANELRPPSPPSPSASSLPRIPLSLMNRSSLVIEPEGESRTSVDFDSAVLLDDLELTPTNENQEIVIGGKDDIELSITSRDSIVDNWKDILGEYVEIVIAHMVKDVNGGLGISLEGTVDVEDGKEVRPHHYIRSILPDGPVGMNAILQSGDELLEVNSKRLLGLNHLEVVETLKNLPATVCLVCARNAVTTRIIDTAQHREAFQARKILAGSLQTLIPKAEFLVKAKSDSSLTSSIASAGCLSGLESKSRSMEIGVGLPVWSDQPYHVELTKAEHGLGFSILDYQDPLNPQETMIVIRSLVPGGVAQADGRLIPGDRLLSVNDIDLSHSTLDRAVQVLKGAAKGRVKIAVAKPLASHDRTSNSSQECLTDEQADHTCLDDFHECIEEYQECLEVVHICIEDEHSFNHSSCGSQVEDFGTSNVNSTKTNSVTTLKIIRVESEECTEPTKSDTIQEVTSCDSDKVSTKREVNLTANGTGLIREIGGGGVRQDSSISDNKLQTSLTISRVTDDISGQDGYETCVDESLSDDVTKGANANAPTGNGCPANNAQNDHANFLANDSGTIDFTASEPCLNTRIYSKRNHICLDSKAEDQNNGLKSYDDQTDSFGGDQFFLVEYIDDDIPETIHQAENVPSKWISEPNVIESSTTTISSIPTTTRYRRCLKEYYNDYEECIEAYRKHNEMLEKQRLIDNRGDRAGKEMQDDEIFCDVSLPPRCRSAPDVLDSSFVMMTYDPGPGFRKKRRKSAFVLGYDDDYEGESLSMTVTRSIETIEAKESECSDMLDKHWGPSRTVKVLREPNTSLGISIVGGKVNLSTNEIASDAVLGIFVKNVVPQSPAGRTGQFQTGDRILEVSGVNLRNVSHEKAVETIRNAPNPVIFLVQSLTPWTSDKETDEIVSKKSSPAVSPNIKKSKQKLSVDNEKPIENFFSSEKLQPPATPVILPSEVPNGAQDGTTVTKTSPESKQPPVLEPVISANSVEKTESSDDSDDDEDVRDLEGRTVTQRGQEIDRASAGNVKRTKEEAVADPEKEDDFGYTTNKIKKKYANLGHSVVMVQLERSSAGLGLSLAGHRDRNCMAVFVCGLNPTGAAFKTGGIQVGDEILEVNGVVLHGRCHLNASAIIKGLSGPIFKVIILRRKAAIEDIAVRPITQFPISLAEETSEEHFNNYPNVRTVTIKKGTQSLGIMIIEGRHAEVGQGIFISDIQEGSSAEKAGLEIGELILAVNKDVLLGSNYDSAANLLKRTEGLVTLVVSNPNKRAVSPAPSAGLHHQGDANSINKSSGGLKTSAPPSRATTPVPEPPADPTTCPIHPGRDTAIEIVTDSKGLGIFFVGGKDTLIPGGIIVVEIFPGGSVEKDGRIQPGDQIQDVAGTSLHDVTYAQALQALRQTPQKQMKLTIGRPEKVEFTTVDLDLVKKPGKGLGLSIIGRKNGSGIYVSEVINGGCADIDGRLMKGDMIVSVNGQNIGALSIEDAGSALKTAVGKTNIKIHRHKAIAR